MLINKDKLVKSKGYYEGSIDAVDEKTALVSSDYKKNICKNFIALNPEQIESRVAGEEFFVTRKYDGEMNVIFFNGSDTFTINTGGKVRMGLPCIEEAGNMLKKAGIKSAIIPAELYVCEKEGRTRVFDVLSMLSKEDTIPELCLAPFDIIEVDENIFKSKTYEEVHKKLDELFAESDMIKPVLYKKVTSKSELEHTYRKWVEEDGSEGLVVRSELPMVYKIKPKHNLDAVIVGYTEGSGDSKGQIRTLLLALMTGEKQYQIVAKTGNGFKDEQKKMMFDRLSQTVIDSDYIDTDSNHVAFRMVKPEVIIELSFNDAIFETTTVGITNPVLALEDNKYTLQCICSGVSLIYPIFVRIRDDKMPNEYDLRMTQITDTFYAPEIGKPGKAIELPKSEVLFREVYKKEAKDKLMVQKFMVWKTNKESIEEKYPAYVMYYTNFSSDRKDPLQRDIRISNSKDQILELVKMFIEENVKKGWAKVENK